MEARGRVRVRVRVMALKKSARGWVGGWCECMGVRECVRVVGVVGGR